MSDLATSPGSVERQPSGALLLRTLAMPADTNPNGDIFGGWLMSQMDMGGAILAKELARGRVVIAVMPSLTCRVNSHAAALFSSLLFAR